MICVWSVCVVIILTVATDYWTLICHYLAIPAFTIFSVLLMQELHVLFIIISTRDSCLVFSQWLIISMMRSTKKLTSASPLGNTMESHRLLSNSGKRKIYYMQLLKHKSAAMQIDELLMQLCLTYLWQDIITKNTSYLYKDWWQRFVKS